MINPEAGERVARRWHWGLLAAAAVGLGVILWRTYGFEPLRIVEHR